MDLSVFSVLRAQWPDKATAWDLGKRPLPRRCSNASALQADTAIVALCEPRTYQQLSRQWHDRDTTWVLDEALHQLELERAARPPVIEVTVTAPPEGIPRAELNVLVRGEVARFAGNGPATPRARRVATATRRARDYIRPPEDPPAVREVRVP
jgi:hypothetical protein